MIDIKPDVFAALKAIPGVKAVTDAYPSDWGNLPAISFYEIANGDPLRIASGPLSDIAIQVDVWHNKSTGTLAAAVDEVLNALGLRRELAADIPDPSGVKHKTMRYRGVVDARSGRVTQ